MNRFWNFIKGIGFGKFQFWYVFDCISNVFCTNFFRFVANSIVHFGG